MITDGNGLIADVNGAFTCITGYEHAEVIGKDPQLFRSGRQSPRIFRAMRRALMRFGEWRGEIWSRRKNGEAYSVFMNVSRVSGGKGEVTNYVALFSDITPLKLQQEQLEHGAYFDALTDLPNRLVLSDRLQQAWVNCQRHNQVLAVLYMDLNGFKFVNRVLAACAIPVCIEGAMLTVTASIGVAVFPADEADADQLPRHADHAMYEAKRSGINRFHVFDAAHDAEVKQLGIGNCDGAARRMVAPGAHAAGQRQRQCAPVSRSPVRHPIG